MKLGAVGIGSNGRRYPTSAGLLMFGNEHDIVREYNAYFLDYQEQYDADTRWTDRIISSSGDWSGNVYDFYFRVYNKLTQDIKVPFKMEGGTRVDDTSVHQALREALANCLVNADYYGRQGLVVIKKRDAIRGVISMPSNIFATTGTNVSILFLDRENKDGNVILMDASKLGTNEKVDGKNQRTVLSKDEITRIIATFNAGKAEDDFCVTVSYADIEGKKHSFSAGQYFEVKIEYVKLTPEEFAEKMDGFTSRLDGLFAESHRLEDEIKKQLERVHHE